MSTIQGLEGAAELISRAPLDRVYLCCRLQKRIEHELHQIKLSSPPTTLEVPQPSTAPGSHCHLLKSPENNQKTQILAYRSGCSPARQTWVMTASWDYTSRDPLNPGTLTPLACKRKKVYVVLGFKPITLHMPSKGSVTKLYPQSLNGAF